MQTNKTYSGIPGDSRCECADSGCSAHKDHTRCNELATTILYRVDMEDVTGTAFCNLCADDASESGLFTDSTDDEEEELQHSPTNQICEHVSANQGQAPQFETVDQMSKGAR